MCKQVETNEILRQIREKKINSYGERESDRERERERKNTEF